MSRRNANEIALLHFYGSEQVLIHGPPETSLLTPPRPTAIPGKTPLRNRPRSTPPGTALAVTHASVTMATSTSSPSLNLLKSSRCFVSRD